MKDIDKELKKILQKFWRQGPIKKGHACAVPIKWNNCWPYLYEDAIKDIKELFKR